MSARRWAMAGLVALVATACGGEDRELVVITRYPEPQVDEPALPDMTRDGEPFPLRAPDDGLLVVYFGFTNCPDVCPTTLAKVRAGLDDLGDDAERVEVAMVSVDPDRDTDVIAEYVQSFVPDAHGLATSDAADLKTLADSFGITYAVEVRPDGEVEVGHSNYLFGVDDTGTLAVTWRTDIDLDDFVADVEQLLDE